MSQLPAAEEKFTEAYIQEILARDFCIKKNHEMVVPNIKCTHGWWEADLLSITRSSLIHEFEIKCSRSDWRKELNQITNDQIHPGRKRYRFETISEQFDSDDDHKSSPNYFWVVAPEGVVNVDELPPYAGLIHVYFFRGKPKIKKVVAARRIHPFKATDKEIMAMARGLNYRLWDCKMWSK